MLTSNIVPRMGCRSQTVAAPMRVDGECTAFPSPSGAPVLACPDCKRVFTSKIGLGIHVRRAHVEVANNKIVTGRTKARWCDEELRLVAMYEAEAQAVGLRGNGLISLLLELHPRRTFDSLKSHRRMDKHKTLVKKYYEEIISRNTPVTLSAEAALTAPATNSLDDDDSQLETVNDRGEHTSPVRRVRSNMEMTAAKMAVALLATVTGHGSETLLRAAERLVDENVNPTEEISRWYLEYGKQTKAQNTGTGDGRDNSPRWQRTPFCKRNNLKPKTSAKALKAAAYRRNVAEWRRGSNRVVDRILSGNDSGALMPPFRQMYDYWLPVIAGSVQSHEPDADTPVEDVTHTIFETVSAEEVTKCLPSAKSSAGPDGFSARLWRRIPSELLAGLFNLLIATGESPKIFTASRTIFVPKKGDPECPENYRPISIASVALRHFHRILARRLEKLSLIDARQRAFRCADGVAENLFLLDSLLRDARSACKGLCLASLDLSKAFDSVYHDSITSAMRRAGLDRHFVDYIRRVYDRCETSIQVGKQSSPIIRVLRGVRQGDPLSPLLFNLVIDAGLAALPGAVGYMLGSARVDALAFADDVVLVAETQAGLQASCEAFATRLAVTGLRLNPMKSSSLSLVPSGRDRKLKVVNTVYSVGGKPLVPIDVSTLWRYLGIDFVGGRQSEFNIPSFVTALGRITSAPMTPQMRLALARDHLIPKFVHGLTFTVVPAGKLRQLAYETRRVIRKWLDLPTSCPSSFIHAPTTSGGLGVPDFEGFVPKIRVRRLVRLQHSPVLAVREAFRLHSTEILAASRRAVEKDLLKPSHEQLLHASVDGAELKLCSARWESTAYMRRPDGIPGKEFKMYGRLRVNGLPSRKRMQRGRNGPTSCRACGAPSETLAHIVQNCPRTHGGRLLRHDHVVKRIASGLTEKGYTVETEHLYKLSNGNLKPDLVATKDVENSGKRSVIVDVQVVSATNTQDWHQQKVRKYASRLDLKSEVQKRSQSTDVQTVAATITWKGVWLPESLESLRALGLSRGFLAGLVTRVLRGSIMNWYSFNKRTDVFGRAGVG